MSTACSSEARLRADVPDARYWMRLVKCQDACPVNTDARGYVRAVAAGDFDRAYRIARGPNPLASICGLVCGAPCEAACRRGEIDQPVSIRALKRFVTERHGPESTGAVSSAILESLRDTDAQNAAFEEFGNLIRAQLEGRLEKAGGQRVAIIGSGPAGLACAHDLALLGFKPVIFEIEKVPGGMLGVGIPAYRLPREVIRAEISVIEALGVEIRLGVEVGKDVAFAALREEFSAVVVAVGAKTSRWLKLPGSDAAGIYGGVDFLRAVSVDEPMKLGERVVVIGGGNVAYDVGRTVLRQEQADVSRTAVRQGAREVTLCCLESLEEMPADNVEIVEGSEEGIVRRTSLGPVEFETDEAGRVSGVVFQRCLRVFDENRRFAPQFDETDRVTIACDAVLLSVGQSPNLGFLDAERDGIEIDRRGYPVADPETLAIADGVYVAGDLAHGPKLLIHAIASGKQVARSIYHRFTGRRISPELLQVHTDLGPYRREDGYEATPRVPIPSCAPGERTRSQSVQVESGYDEAAARREASRCLDCGVNTIFDSSRCILCGGCADVCPEQCLRLVPATELLAEGPLGELLESGVSESDLASMSAIVKDEARCIRCALCAIRCPVDAITMERMTFRAEYTVAG